MPTYEYTCRDCGHTFDIVQSMWDEALTMCPECGGSLRKVFAPPAISFKGSGFYATDHGKKSKGAAESKAAAESKGGSKGDGDRKPEAKGSGEGSKAADARDAAPQGTSDTPSTAPKKEPAPS
jgi:putative FmdB family regulatory protein